MANTALILGANGITGSYLVEHLLGQPSSSWAKVIATSRRPPNPDWVEKDLPAGVLDSGRLVWFEADLLNESPAELKKKFSAAGCGAITHVFWGAYLLPPQGNGSPEEREINKKLFDNTLSAVLACNSGALKRIVLQLGIKYYLQANARWSWSLPTRETNVYPTSHMGGFYIEQLNSVRKACKGQSFDFVVTTPAGIWGYTRQCQMTFATSLAMYAMIKAHLGEPLEFPGTRESYYATHDASPAAFLAEMNVWCATTPAAGGRVFNAVGGDVYSWSHLWPKVAEYFGAICPDPSTLPKAPADHHSTAKEMDSGKGRAAWNQIVAKYGGALKESDYEYATFWFLDLMLYGNESSYLFVSFLLPSIIAVLTLLPFPLRDSSMTQARSLGFTGYSDSELALLEIFRRMQKDGLISDAMVTGKGLGVFPNPVYGELEGASL